MKPKNPDRAATQHADALLHKLLLSLKTKTLKEVSQCKAGITRLDFAVLHVLSEHADPVTMTELSEGLGVEPPTIVASVHRLEHKKLLTKARDPNDRRRLPLVITPAGKALNQKIIEPSLLCMSKAFEAIGEQKSKKFLSILQEIVEYHQLQNP
jgi:MarR family transcriptional regulator for hemolysin